jgi:xanthine dehydrogenase accessory factor
MSADRLRDVTVVIKGAGEMASGIAWRLSRSNFRRIAMLESPSPTAVRRLVCFCEAVHERVVEVEGIRAVLARDCREIPDAWREGAIPVLVDPEWKTIDALRPQVTVDAILAKRNLGTSLGEAELVLALGPGFEAGRDAHMVIETNRGHDLGRIIEAGRAQENTGLPGAIAGHTRERVLRAPRDGVFTPLATIRDTVRRGEPVGSVENVPVHAGVDGVLRGLLRAGTPVRQGAKLGDVDPRGEPGFCSTISEKARALGGSVLEAILRRYNG